MSGQSVMRSKEIAYLDGIRIRIQNLFVDASQQQVVSEETSSHQSVSVNGRNSIPTLRQDRCKGPTVKVACMFLSGMWK